MKASILLRKVVANNPSDAMRIIREEYPRARMVTYRMVHNLRDVSKEFREEHRKNREMIVAFVDDADLVWE